jgi:hypothetical protein
LLADRGIVERPPEPAVSPLHILVVVSLALSALIWGATFIYGGQALQMQRFLALLGFYGVSSVVFVASRIRRGRLQLFEIPVFLTIMIFVQFGLVPLRNFLDPSLIDVNLSPDGRELVEALAYVILGMIAFWLGCELIRRKGGDRISPSPAPKSIVSKSRNASVLLSFWALYAVGSITRVYLLRNELFSYTMSGDRYLENLASMQVLNFVEQVGILALIIVTIEWYRAPKDALWGALFILALATEIVWGLISGMKAPVLQTFLVVAIVSSLVTRRLNLRWLVILPLGLVLLYPVSNAYRSLVFGGGAVTSFEEAAQTGQIAVNKVRQSEPTVGDILGEGVEHSLARLDLLTSVAQVLTLDDRADMVRGHVQWWMIPIYPFIPRLVWPSKPILQECGWFTAALSGGSTSLSDVASCTAITYPGDLYLQFGWWGIPVGMFILGVVTQWFANRVSGAAEPRELFLYTALFILGFWYEADVFSMWTGFIKLTAILYVMRYVIYGPNLQHRRQGVWSVVARHP